jgi:hypothetical protein
MKPLRGVLRHADPPVVMLVEVEEGAARLVIVLCLDLRVHPSKCNK